MGKGPSEYWLIAVECALDESSIASTAEQRIELAKFMENAAEMEWECTGRSSIPNPQTSEIDRLQTALRLEKEKVGCADCRGTGRLNYNSGPWAVNTQCGRCNGEGKRKP